MDQNTTCRLVTRSNFDGLACAALLKEQNLIHDVLFVHPQEMEGISIGEGDILTNLPPDERAHLVFNTISNWPASQPGIASKNLICDPGAKSAARVIYQHYGEQQAFPRISGGLIDAVDQGNTAQFSQLEILNPKDWVLFNFLMDPRTGIGRFRNFRLSNRRLILLLIDLCRVQEVAQIMTLPDIQERVEVYFSHQERFLEQLTRCATVQDNLVILDVRGETVVWPGNRFMIYALYPKCNLSIQVLWGAKKEYTVFSIGKSILNRTSDLDIGKLAHTFGGGGHRNAGTCRSENNKAEKALKKLILEIG